MTKALMVLVAFTAFALPALAAEDMMKPDDAMMKKDSMAMEPQDCSKITDEGMKHDCMMKGDKSSSDHMMKKDEMKPENAMKMEKPNGMSK